MELPIKKPAGDFVVVPTEPTIDMLNAYDEARAATTMKGQPAGDGLPAPPDTYNPHQSYWALLHAAEALRLPDFAIVPVKLTDAMRERMAHIADGPLRSHDEVWAEMLDAAFVNTTAAT